MLFMGGQAGSGDAGGSACGQAAAAHLQALGPCTLPHTAPSVAGFTELLQRLTSLPSSKLRLSYAW
jgi:hypothetical protein